MNQQKKLQILTNHFSIHVNRNIDNLIEFLSTTQVFLEQMDLSMLCKTFNKKIIDINMNDYIPFSLWFINNVEHNKMIWKMLLDDKSPPISFNLIPIIQKKWNLSNQFSKEFLMSQNIDSFLFEFSTIHYLKNTIKTIRFPVILSLNDLFSFWKSIHSIPFPNLDSIFYWLYKNVLHSFQNKHVTSIEHLHHRKETSLEQKQDMIETSFNKKETSLEKNETSFKKNETSFKKNETSLVNRKDQKIIHMKDSIHVILNQLNIDKRRLSSFQISSDTNIIYRSKSSFVIPYITMDSTHLFYELCKTYINQKLFQNTEYFDFIQQFLFVKKDTDKEADYSSYITNYIPNEKQEDEDHKYSYYQNYRLYEEDYVQHWFETYQNCIQILKDKPNIYLQKPEEIATLNKKTLSKWYINWFIFIDSLLSIDYDRKYINDTWNNFINDKSSLKFHSISIQSILDSLKHIRPTPLHFYDLFHFSMLGNFDKIDSNIIPNYSIKYPELSHSLIKSSDSNSQSFISFVTILDILKTIHPQNDIFYLQNYQFGHCISFHDVTYENLTLIKKYFKISYLRNIDDFNSLFYILKLSILSYT
jgi:hypothetical protein